MDSNIFLCQADANLRNGNIYRLCMFACLHVSSMYTCRCPQGLRGQFLIGEIYNYFSRLIAVIQITCDWLLVMIIHWNNYLS